MTATKRDPAIGAIDIVVAIALSIAEMGRAQRPYAAATNERKPGGVDHGTG
jgi:hypothetical protein